MTYDQIKEARQKLGLTQAQLAQLLDTSDHVIRRLEMSPDKSSHRDPAPRMIRLLMAYLDGYRPDDWPA